jgi:lipopolysaccharide transport system permease protein
VYTPESRLRHPAALLEAMAKDLVASRELAWRLFVRNVSARYRQTLLGYVWAFLPPIAGSGIFVFLRRSGAFVVDDTGVPYVLFLVTGLVLWQTFVDAVHAPVRMVAQSKSMLAKINFPREALILAGIAEVLFNFLVRALLLIAVFAWFRALPSATALLAPAGLVVLVALGIAIGVALVPLSVLYQDVEQGLTLFVSFWLFVTPVLYPVPVSYPGSLTLTLNPVSPVLDTVRSWLLTGPAPHAAGFAAVGLGTFAILFVAWVVYRLALPILIERMSA